MALIGYARVSKDEQVTESQMDELRAAGCDLIVEEHAPGASRSRPVLAQALGQIKSGDTLVVVRLDRLARSLKHLLEVIEQLESIGAHFRSLRDPVDTSSPQGEFTLQILGAVAQLERKLVSQRTKAALDSARARGRIGGNPKLRSRDQTAIRKLSQARKSAHTFDLIANAEEWLPTVQRMRPKASWTRVTKSVNSKLPRERRWTMERLKRATRRMVSEGLAAKELLDRAPARSDDRLMKLVAGIAMANPKLTLQQVGHQLKAMREQTPRGGKNWAPSSVKNLLDRAKATGYLG